MKKAQQKISDNTIRRLPKYLWALGELEAAGRERLSSTELGDMLGLTYSQIRQDFNYKDTITTKISASPCSVCRRTPRRKCG